MGVWFHNSEGAEDGRHPVGKLIHGELDARFTISADCAPGEWSVLPFDSFEVVLPFFWIVSPGSGEVGGQACGGRVIGGV